MKPMRPMPLWHSLIFCFLGLFMAACTDLAGQPEIVRTLPPPTQAPAELGYPEAKPDMLRAAALYQLHCTSCHGEQGDGQGELVLSGQIPAMPSFLEADPIRRQLPRDYFNIITQGNIANLMPPWRDTLTEQQRWDLALYTYTLAYSEADLVLGAELYAAECASCHGESGLGDGPDMIGTGRDANNLQDPATAAVISDLAWFTSISEGIGEAMPGYADQFSEDEIWALVAASRRFSLANLGASRGLEAPVIESTSQPDLPESITITGSLSNGSAGGTVPPELSVGLRYGNFEDGLQTQEVSVQPDGSYRFEAVPLNPDYEYVSFAFYLDRIFISEVRSGAVLPTNADLSVVLYELTEDPFVISITQIETLIESITVSEMGTGLLITQRVHYNNESDRVYSSSRGAGNGRYASLLWQLPPGAVILNDPANPRYLQVPQQFALVDTDPVYPGEHQLDAVFFLSYENGAIIEQPLSNALVGEMLVNLAVPRLNLVGDGWQAVESDSLEAGQRLFSRQFSLAPGDILGYELSGNLRLNTSSNSGVITSDTLLPLLLGGVLILFMLIGLIFIVSARRQNTPDQMINRIVRQIAELDALHNAGTINHDVYRHQRQELKDRLAKLMSETKPREGGSDETRSND